MHGEDMKPKLSKTRWYIDDLKMHSWLLKYPKLRQKIECLCCGEVLQPKKAFISGHYAAIESTKCDCNAQPVCVFTIRNRIKR
jgi:hypothetical protein